jgi:hypothetical protein
MRHVISLLFVILLVACAKAEAPVSVSKINTPNRWERSPTYVPLVKIVAKVDNVTIQQVIFNRGNCQAPWNEQAAPTNAPTNKSGITCTNKTDALGNTTTACEKSNATVQQPTVSLEDRLREMWLGMVGIQLPKSLKFGETLELPLVAGVCELLEAEVKTDKGDWTFTFEK